MGYVGLRLKGHQAEATGGSPIARPAFLQGAPTQCFNTKPHSVQDHPRGLREGMRVPDFETRYEKNRTHRGCLKIGHGHARAAPPGLSILPFQDISRKLR